MWNGHYTRAPDSKHFSKADPVYVSTTPACTHCSLYTYEGVWRLAIDGKGLFYVAAAPSALPPTAAKDWEVSVGGKAPVPTLVAGPV